MGLFEHFPYLNMHELNLNWLIQQTKANTDAIEDLNAIEDPKTFLVTTTGTLVVNTPKIGTVASNCVPLDIYNKLSNDLKAPVFFVKAVVNGTVISFTASATRGGTKGVVYITCEGYQYVDDGVTYTIRMLITGSGGTWTANVVRTA